jgi:SAM-dependent methyltransferase
VTEPFSIYDYLTDGEDDAAGRQAGQLLAGNFHTPVMLAIMELGIPALLADKGLLPDEVAAAAGTAPDATARLLRAGMAIGLLAADFSGRFTLTELGDRLRPGTNSLGEIAGFWTAPLREAMAGLADHVRNGMQVDPAAPGGFWDYLGSHPEDVAGFSRAMGFVTSRMLAALTAAGYRPPSFRRIVDVGGNRGTLLAWFLKTVPEASGVVFDRSEARAAATEFLTAAGVGDRAEFVAGSFLDEVPQGDLHVLSQVLHDWDDDNVRRIVGNCARAARPGGSLVVIGYALPSVPEPAVGHLMDILMMVLLGGRERTREEHEALMEPTGYTFTREVPLYASGSTAAHPPWRVLEFRRG